MASADQETSTDTLREHVPDRHLDESLRVLDLEKEADEVRRTEPFRARGLSAKTLAKYDDLRLVLALGVYLTALATFRFFGSG